MNNMEWPFLIFLITIFSANLKNSHVRYSDSQVARYSRITGSQGKSVEEVCQHNITCEFFRLAENIVIRKIRKVHSMLFM
jgi:hypothetical protein